MPIEPAENFDNYLLSKGMLKAIESANYTSPTPVQHSTLPLVLAGLDLIVQSQTGTGKTAAFTIPILETMKKDAGQLEVLVLTPTRELAKQVSGEFEKFGEHKGIACATIYGGTSYEKQYEALETAQIVTATPGRLKDLIDRGKVDLSNLRFFVLDEADEMLSMGFQEEVDAILRRLPEERQSLLFSATITNEVRALGRKMLFYPEYISHSDENVATEDVTHAFYRVDGVGRVRDLVRFLEFEEPENAIVFANTKDDTFMVTSFLKRYGFRADALNGDLPQTARERTLAKLKDGEIDFLIATDVAARGIDISDLSYVINYMLPDSPEVYVHRTGRTGRAGRKGRAVSLVSAGELATLFAVKKLYEVPIKEERFPTSREVVARKQQNFVKRLVSTVSDASPKSGHLGVAKYLTSHPTDENVKLIAHLLELATQPGAKTSVKKMVEPDEVSEGRNGYDKTTRKPKRDESKTDSNRDDDRKKRSDDRGDDRKRDDRKKDDRKKDDRQGKKDDRKKDDRKQDDRKQDDRKKEGRKKDDRNRGDRKKGDRKKDDRKTGDRKTGDRKGRNDDRKSDSKKTDKNKGRSNKRDNGHDRPQKEQKETRRMSRIWVNAGKDNFDTVSSIEEMVCEMAGVDTEDLGKVTLEETFSYIEVRRDYFFDIIKAMNKQEYNGLTLSAEPARK